MDSCQRPAKRRMQANLTTYFDKVPLLPTSQAAKPSSSSPSNPPLPASIQSSLLNVGMRVRKSVPEGYKNNPHIHNAKYGETGKPMTAYRSGAAELVPYCGMMKVGGYQAQPSRGVDALHASLFEIDESEVDLSSSSQESIENEEESAVLPVAVSHYSTKRRFSDDNEDGGILVDGTGTIVQHTEATPVSMALRPIAQARGHRPAAFKDKVLIEEDFEEATFLRGLDEDMDFDE
ncbi:MAG: hypothetical protein Q9220_000875 [cf. Caloplaca sp. 1 TL-2023]